LDKELAIRVDNLSKKFVITHNAERYTALRDVFSNTIKGVFGKKKLSNKEDFWALNDVSFQVNRGDKLGVIGRNGAGKSTLLKVLSRIYEPSKGRVEIYGRMASLLEVGTGFHPELTGRENVFLNGAILGMNHSEIKRKFDEIVAFAEVEKFLDTPVKRYSSGMYVRLAFAVAAHLDSEILIVDEVLAVGDSQFQKKCLGKMEDASSSGRTVLFVSHNLETVQRLCNKSILLDKGCIKQSGSTQEIVRAYLSTGNASNSIREWNDVAIKPSNGKFTLLKVWAHNELFVNQESFDITKPIGISMKYEALIDGEIATHSFNFHNEDGVNIFDTHDTNSSSRDIPKTKGEYMATMWIPPNLMAEGTIVVGAAVIKSDPFQIHIHEKHAISFMVIDYMRGDSARGSYTLGFPGVVRPLCQWHTEKINY